MNLLNVCRCCLASDCYKDMSNEYFCNGEKEVYCNMLLETFNINISHQDDSNKRLICETCIMILRNANAFKRKVIQIEALFMKKIDEIKEHTEILLPKEEAEDTIYSDDKQSSDELNNDFKWTTDAGDIEEIISIKTEVEDEVFGLSKCSQKRSNVSVKRKTSKRHLEKKTGKTQKKTVSKTDSKKDIDSINRLKKRKFKSDYSEAERKSQINSKENSKKLILNSNLCLFRSLKIKFQCFYCKEAFPHMKDLREHTKTHKDGKKYMYRRINALRGLSYRNVDISSLECNQCSRPCNDLNELKSHLTSQHKIEFSDGQHFLIPYNLEKGFNCLVCNEEFSSFLTLSMHMNKHYRNNVCEICGVSFINRLSLRCHVHMKHREKKCTLCTATFVSTYHREKHMKTMHKKLTPPKRYCPLCNKTFSYAYQLYEHKIQKHGVQRPAAVCKECGKRLLSVQNLKLHMRSVHIKERNYPCSLCEMRFFRSSDRERHQKTHSDDKCFSCTFCEVKFKAKDSLRRHLKRQHGQSMEK